MIVCYHKTCNGCGVELTSENLSAWHSRHQGRQCNKCRNIKRRIYYASNKEHILETNKKGMAYQRGKKKSAEYGKKYRRKHHDRLIEPHREYRRKYRASLPANHKLKIRNRLKVRILHALKGNRKCTPTMMLLGCSIERFRSHLESLWQPGMSWENYGVYRIGGPMTWHIDHIRPCDVFDLTDPEQQKQCFNWSNMQPLWAIDNLAKGKKLLTPPRKEPDNHLTTNCKHGAPLRQAAAW